MDGDDRGPADFERPPCSACGAYHHVPCFHSGYPNGHVGSGSEPIQFATEEVVVEDDDKR